MVVDQILGYISTRVEKHCRKMRQCFFQAFSPLPTMFLKAFYLSLLPDMPILGFSNSAGNTDMISEIWTNGETIIRLSRKHWNIFQKLSVVDASKCVSMD